jgi:hypothetical protein
MVSDRIYLSHGSNFHLRLFWHVVYTFRSHYWLWCPISATILGGQFGAAIYDMLIFTGSESIINKSYVAPALF